ncbi:hypothetical protein IFR04_014687 [Cadophora malorum]|uniref:Uncharacterized protein n=1 Tax=Cadophora malorum TaxID=108018 RepID=A0A8H7W4P1_9HELO|nr:hypothetical protein IFR04_014687 [Cadophora malorum]
MLPGCTECNGRDLTKEDTRAVWLSLPYFALMDLESMNRYVSSTSTLHPIRTLTQTQYDDESTRDHDIDQVLKLWEEQRAGELLHVPQVWCLILGTEMIITCAHDSFTRYIRVRSSRQPYKFRLVKVIDPYKRQFFFPIADCSTFFELKQMITERCLGEECIKSVDDCLLLLEGKERLSVELWTETIRSRNSLIIMVCVIEKGNEEIESLSITSVMDRNAALHNNNETSNTESERVTMISEKGAQGRVMAIDLDSTLPCANEYASPEQQSSKKVVVLPLPQKETPKTAKCGPTPDLLLSRDQAKLHLENACKSVSFTAAGPYSIVLEIFGNLFAANVAANLDIVTWYAKRASGVKYKIYHKTPRRRLLGEIQLIQEEMSTVITILVQQRDCIGQYALICDPNNFRTSNPARSQQYELEMILLSSRQVELDTLIERMEQQLQNLTTLEQRARHRIEVREEDNRKTIFVLTVIAAIFLPLSFITSYLGMNTADIRDMDKSQTIFWIVSVPTTVVVLVLALLAANKGDVVGEWLLKRESRRKKQKFAKKQLKILNDKS